MKEEHRPTWIELALIAAAFFGLVLGVVAHVWMGAVASGILLVALLSLITRTPRLSQAQQVAIGFLVVAPILVWRVVMDRWLSVAIGGIFIVVYPAWLLWIIRREGWSGAKTGDPE